MKAELMKNQRFSGSGIDKIHTISGSGIDEKVIDSMEARLMKRYKFSGSVTGAKIANNNNSKFG